ncbi:hypothetical protein BDY19DRAFT_996855 [Irpex rosettiformis]|uniref:Uncharacterized protein n=1 Tax=Irpex rosettiformis TaxID=378272 RepID=A0ACB8TTD3_9APHY|nr:hypothetical protein BDY19DRAFT_996855 [Irpex rosettiformis]
MACILQAVHQLRLNGEPLSLAEWTIGNRYPSPCFSIMFGQSLSCVPRLPALPLTLLPLLSLVIAQSFDLPSNWRKPTSTLSRSDRLALLDGLLNTVSRTLNSSNGLFVGLTGTQTTNMLCALAIGDHINSSTTSKDVVLNSLNTMFTSIPDIIGSESRKLTSDAALWGLAAIYAYTAYGDSTSLERAQSMWALVSAYLVTAATTGTRPSGDVVISAMCNGVAFISNHLYDGTIILDEIDLGTCNTSTELVTYNSGYTVKGLSVLVDVVPRNTTEEYASLCVDAHSLIGEYLYCVDHVNKPSEADFNSCAVSVLDELVRWGLSSKVLVSSPLGITIYKADLSLFAYLVIGPTNANGANNNFFSITLKAILIRGLLQAYIRMPNNTDQANFIRSFITVQLNALLDLASIPETNQYSPRWEGLSPSSLLPWGQLAAIDVLVSAVGLTGYPNSSVVESTAAAASSSTSSISSSNPSSPQTSIPQSQLHVSHSISSGVIGRIIAGTLSILLALLANLLHLKRKRHQLMDDSLTSETTPRPYFRNNDLETPRMREIHTGSARRLHQTFTSKVLRERQLTSGSQRTPNAHEVPRYTTPNLSTGVTTPTLSPPILDNTAPPLPTSNNTVPPPSTSNREAGYMPVWNRQLIVDAASFPRFVERLITVILSESENTQRSSLEGHVGMVEREAPPRYEE